MNEPFDVEFKLYLHSNGINVDSNIFDLQFNPPQNFASYRQAEMDTARVNTFNTMVAIPMISKRFALKRFLGLSSEEVAENETLWKEENIDEDQGVNASGELRGAGITANGMAGDVSSLGSSEPLAPEDGSEPVPGSEGSPGEAAPATPPPA
jgi:hypothetical protein